MKKNSLKKTILSIPLTTVMLAATFSVLACGKDKEEQEETVSEIKSKASTPGIRIAWDYSTLRLVSDDALASNYNGYGRVKQLNDKTLIAIYESGGSIIVRKSADNGNSWNSTVVVAEKMPGTNMAVPDLLELKDGSLLAMYNPRPYSIDPSRKFGIRIKKSYDKGTTWKDEQLLYEAGYQFENGCWEPAAIQLPGGEIQLYFANEGPYTSTDEQNISLLRSSDNGITWTKNPEIVSFRAGKRDGMPAPLLLRDNTTIVFAIEDNGFNTFKPYIIRNSISENWANTVTGNSDKRVYALSDKIGDEIYAGAPYLAQLKTGETILSYQGTEGRNNHMNQADMKVVIGDANAKSFGRKTVPFTIVPNKSALWNSITVLDDNSVIAVASTTGYSATNRTEVWMIRGYVIPEIKAGRNSITADGNTTEETWSGSFPMYVGHNSETNVTSKVTYDDNNLYILSGVKDRHVVNGTGTGNSDGVTIFIDPQNKCYEKPHSGVFSISVSAGGFIEVKEGKNGNWQAVNSGGNIKHAAKQIAGGYVQELAIPWAFLGGKPALNTRMGINVRLTEVKAANEPLVTEDASGCNAGEPFGWISLFLE